MIGSRRVMLCIVGLHNEFDTQIWKVYEGHEASYPGLIANGVSGVNTGFSKEGVKSASTALLNSYSSAIAVKIGIKVVELDESVTSAGDGGLSNAAGILQLDAAMMTSKGKMDPSQHRRAIVQQSISPMPCSTIQHIPLWSEMTQLCSPNCTGFLREVI
ncbi:unnamed protein product [Agarophyton chilense]